MKKAIGFLLIAVILVVNTFASAFLAKLIFPEVPIKTYFAILFYLLIVAVTFYFAIKAISKIYK